MVGSTTRVAAGTLQVGSNGMGTTGAAPSYITSSSGVTAVGSRTVTVASTAGLLPGMQITDLTGTFVPFGTTIASVNSATQITLSNPATAVGSGLTFSSASAATRAIVDPSAILAGTGTVQGNTLINGLLKPGDVGGNGIGTLTINGNLTLSTGSTTVFQLHGASFNVPELMPSNVLSNFYNDVLNGALVGAGATYAKDLTTPVLSNQHDQVIAAGTISINSGAMIQLVLNGYSPKAGDVFQLLDFNALGGLNTNAPGALIVDSSFNPGTQFRLGGEAGTNLDLPSLGESFRWDTSLFMTQGLLAVVAYGSLSSDVIISPIFAPQPQCLVVPIGTAATFTADAFDNNMPMQFVWRKSDAVIIGSMLGKSYTTPVLTKANIAANLGKYSVVATDHVGHTTASVEAELGAVVTDPVAPMAVVDGATTALSVVAYGTTVSYQWKRAGGSRVVDGAQPDGSVFSGAKTAKLTITAIHPTEANTYHCTVTVGTNSVPGLAAAGHLDGPSITVNVVQKPVPVTIAGNALPAGMVGTPYTFTYPRTVSTDPTLINAPTKFTSTGAALPPGLTINATTGVISGIVSGTWLSPKTFLGIKITASNAAGAVTSPALSLTINQGLPPVLGTPGAGFYTGKVNVSYSYQIPFDPTRPVTAWSASGLPPGLTINKTTGLISGSPSGISRVAVSYKAVKITATNYAGTVSSPLYTIVISPGDIPKFVTPVPTSLPSGKVSVLYSAPAPSLDTVSLPDSVPVKWSATGLPSGLTINPVTGLISGRPALAGTFSTVKITATNLAGAVSTILHVTIATGDKPVLLSAVTFPSGQVGAAYSFPYPYDTSNPDAAPLKFTATGLPTGLTINPTTGVISGRPTVAATFSVVKITLSNLAGSTPSAAYSITINPFDSHALGTFVGLVDNSGTVTSLTTPASTGTTLGARFDLTTTAAGAFSGKVTIGTIAYPFSGLLDTAPTIPHGTATIKRVGLSVLTVAFDLHGNNMVSGTLSDSNVTSAGISGWRNTWTATNKVTDRLGVHNFIADPVVTPTLGVEPEGTSFGSASIVAAGTATVGGKTATGVAFTTAVPMGPNGELLVYQSLYTNTGSFTGLMAVDHDTTIVSAATVPVHTVTGTMTWSRAAQTAATDFTYKAGWAPISLTVSGGLYYPAPAGKVVMDLATGGAANAQIAFENAGISSASLHPSLPAFVIKPNPTTVAVSLIGVSNLAKTTVNVTNATGAFSGTFTLVDPDPNSTKIPQATITRVVTYQGLIVPMIAAKNDQYAGIGYGWFLLQQLPGLTTTPTTSPILSGLVTLEAN